ncbi:cobalamin-dependent protein, partial [Thermodesulfobacteriota bacterium]
MNLTLIYPKWPKLERQTEFHLPPHGPVVFAAEVPEEINLVFIDETFQEIDYGKGTDLVAISVMLTCQVPRAIEIADRYRKMNIPVIFGGIAAMLHGEELTDHCDSVFMGEVEGRFSAVLEDFKNNRLKKVYDYMNNLPDIDLVGTARREILNQDFYMYRGVKMLDLVHAS